MCNRERMLCDFHIHDRWDGNFFYVAWIRIITKNFCVVIKYVPYDILKLLIESYLRKVNIYKSQLRFGLLLGQLSILKKKCG